jgi:uncharacterized iron-regulated membrane protein
MMGFKLSRHAFTRYWDVHAWAGVLGGLVLHLMFLCGGIALFREPLALWGDPLAQGGAPVSLQDSLSAGVKALGTTPDELWLFPPHRGRGAARLSYADPAGGDWKTAWVDVPRSALVPEREHLSSFLYSIHFLWHDATGAWLYDAAGVLGVLMVVAIVTGLLIHLKDLARQLHQFRPARSWRVTWSDMHKVLGVMGLPFQLAYAYTGAFIVLAPLLLRALVGPVFGGDASRAEAAARGAPPAAGLPAREPSGTALPLDALLARARAALPDLEPEWIQLRHAGRADAFVEVGGRGAGVPSADARVRLRPDGAVVTVASLAGENAARAAHRWLDGLHVARFGGVGARFLLLGLALATCATILTGNWVWLSRREVRGRGRGHRLLARLTVGVGAGSLVAVAAMFLASRALPLHWPRRGLVEELTFLGALALCVAWALAARDARMLWGRQLALAAAFLAPVPVLAARLSDAGLLGDGPRLVDVVGVDVAILAAAAACGATAWAMRRRAAPAPSAGPEPRDA